MTKPETSVADVCVIIPTFNRAEYLGEAIDSALNQTRLPAEIIVVDDGSTDQTPDVAKAYGDRIRYIRKENGSKSVAVNMALKQVRSEYVIIADDDDIMFPSAIAHLLAPLEREPLLDFANGGISFFRDFPDRGRVEVASPAISKVESGHHFEALLMNYTMTHNATLIRRRCYEALGGLDESFRRAQDYEFMLRLTLRFKGITVSERIVNVRRHEGVRGDPHVRHSASGRQLMHFDFGTRAFEMVRRVASLGSYIGRPTDTLSGRDLFEAWFTRAATMARHGVWNGFREDVRECGRHRPGTNPLITEYMANTLSKVFNRSDTIEARLREDGFPGWVIKEFIRELGKGAVWPIARGFYWAGRDAHEDGKRWLMAKCIGFAILAIVLGFVTKSRLQDS